MLFVRLIADTNVLSYIFNESALGHEYLDLIGDERVGVTGHCLAEIHRGAELRGWGVRRRSSLATFLKRFTHVPENGVIARVCGILLAQRQRVGMRLDWPDAWAAATALHFNLPLVTHDRDLEAIPGLRVITAHIDWRIAEPSLIPEGFSAAARSSEIHITRLRTSEVTGSPTVM